MPLPKRVVEPVHVAPNTKILQKSSSSTKNSVHNVLETNINGTLVNIIRQLSNLSKEAEDLFGELINEIHSITVRSNSLQISLDRLSAKTQLLNSTNEKVSLQDIQIIKPFKSAVVFDHEILSRDTMPAKLLEMYSTCDKTPPLNKIDPYREDGKESMKFYSDPNFFLDQWRLEISKDTEKLKQGSIRRSYRLNTEDATSIRRPFNSREWKKQLAINKGEYIMSQNAYRYWAFQQITDSFYNHPIRQNDYQFAKSMGVILCKFGIQGGETELSIKTPSLSKENNSSNSCPDKNLTSSQKLNFKKLSNPNKNFSCYAKPLLPVENTVSTVSPSHSTTIPPPSSLPLILDGPPSSKQKIPLEFKCSHLQSDKIALVKSISTVSDIPPTLINEVIKSLAQQNGTPHHMFRCITNETDNSSAKSKITPETGHILNDSQNKDILMDTKDGVELRRVDVIQQKEQERSNDLDLNMTYCSNIEITDSDSDSDFPQSITCDSDDNWSNKNHTRSLDVLSTDSLTSSNNDCSLSSSHKAWSISSHSLVENNFYSIESFPDRFSSPSSVSIKYNLSSENVTPPPSSSPMPHSLITLANEHTKSSSKQKFSSNHITQSEPTLDVKSLTNINGTDLRISDIGHVAHTKMLPPQFSYSSSSSSSLESIRNSSKLSSMFTTLDNKDITSLPEQHFHNHITRSEPIIDVNTTLTLTNISSIDERNKSFTTHAEYLPPPSMFDTSSMVNNGDIISPPKQYVLDHTIQSEPVVTENQNLTKISKSDEKKTPDTGHDALTEYLSPSPSCLSFLPPPPSSLHLPSSPSSPLLLPPSPSSPQLLPPPPSFLLPSPLLPHNISPPLSSPPFLSPPPSSPPLLPPPPSFLIPSPLLPHNISPPLSSPPFLSPPHPPSSLLYSISSLMTLRKTLHSSSLSAFDTFTMVSHEDIISPPEQYLPNDKIQSEPNIDVNTTVINNSSNSVSKTPGSDHFAGLTELSPSLTPQPSTSSSSPLGNILHSSSLPSMFDTPTVASNENIIIPPPVKYLSNHITQTESTRRDVNTIEVTNSTNNSDARKTVSLDDISLHIDLLEAIVNGVDIKNLEILKLSKEVCNVAVEIPDSDFSLSKK